MTFQDLGIIDPILKALRAQGYEQPTPIQQQAIPKLLKGKDLLGCAQTGTGKTAAFSIPILQQMYEDQSWDRRRREIKCLIVAMRAFRHTGGFSTCAIRSFLVA
jgi:ATP-dependent RNA helicase RhlE